MSSIKIETTITVAILLYFYNSSMKKQMLATKKNISRIEIVIHNFFLNLSAPEARKD